MEKPTSDSETTARPKGEDDSTERAERLKQQAKVRIHAVGDEIDRRLGDIGETAREAADEVVQRARQAVEDQRSALGREVHAVAGALRGAAKQLDDETYDFSADLIRLGAEQIDRVGSAIDERTMPELLDLASEKTREHRWVVFGGTLALGFLAARFLKATNPERALVVRPEDMPSEPSSGAESVSAEGRPG